MIGEANGFKYCWLMKTIDFFIQLVLVTSANFISGYILMESRNEQEDKDNEALKLDSFKGIKSHLSSRLLIVLWIIISFVTGLSLLFTE